jgi:nitrile hydratase subunit beta
VINAQHQFGLNERVRVKVDNPAGNPRTPRYARGQVGTIVAQHGTMDNPLDHRDVYPPLCTVVLDVRDVSGAASRDQLWVDIHEDWLERP